MAFRSGQNFRNGSGQRFRNPHATVYVLRRRHGARHRRIWNAHGEVHCQARISPDVRAGVYVLAKGCGDTRRTR
jgi:hypothetical protein